MWAQVLHLALPWYAKQGWQIVSWSASCKLTLGRCGLLWSLLVLQLMLGLVAVEFISQRGPLMQLAETAELNISHASVTDPQLYVGYSTDAKCSCRHSMSCN